MVTEQMDKILVAMKTVTKRLNGKSVDRKYND
jgi:hypothetical protein